MIPVMNRDVATAYLNRMLPDAEEGLKGNTPVLSFRELDKTHRENLVGAMRALGIVDANSEVRDFERVSTTGGDTVFRLDGDNLRRMRNFKMAQNSIETGNAFAPLPVPPARGMPEQRLIIGGINVLDQSRPSDSMNGAVGMGRQALDALKLGVDSLGLTRGAQMRNIDRDVAAGRIDDQAAHHARKGLGLIR